MPRSDKTLSCNDPNTLADPPLCDCNGGGLSLQLFRTPDAGHVGDTITYTVVLSNPQTNNQCPISGITAAITLPNGSTATLNAPGTLAAGATSGPLTATYTIAVGDLSGSTLAATAQASGILQDCFCNSPTSATSQVCIFVAQPAFTLTKKGSTPPSPRPVTRCSIPSRSATRATSP